MGTCFVTTIHNNRLILAFLFLGMQIAASASWFPYVLPIWKCVGCSLSTWQCPRHAVLMLLMCGCPISWNGWSTTIFGLKLDAFTLPQMVQCIVPGLWGFIDCGLRRSLQAQGTLLYSFIFYWMIYFLKLVSPSHHFSPFHSQKTPVPLITQNFAKFNVHLHTDFSCYSYLDEWRKAS